ncbi:hypothetical protein FWG95_01595 [Candidatus Saccharibacteria bacterium]|nr:hypothetical protein [Candidatus Saccharibacteria bacterium]
MKKLIKAFAAAGTVAMLGVAVVPLTAFAATSTTTVQVQLTTECVVGAGGVNAGASVLTINTISATNPGAEISSASGDYMGITCNNSTWTLTEEINPGGGRTNNDLVGALAPTNTDVFGPWTSGATPAAFAANTWGMRYTEITPMTGNAVTATAYHAVPFVDGTVVTTPNTIANGVAVSGYNIQQTFGANTDGSLAADTYSSQILYTLTGV